jgi:hypothetical protein
MADKMHGTTCVNDNLFKDLRFVKDVCVTGGSAFSRTAIAE